MYDEISLAKFLARYYNLTGKDLKKIRHEDVKELFPDVRRISFEDLRKKPQLLALGIVLLVNDGHRTIPYFAPELTLKETEYNEINREAIPSTINDRFYNYSELNERELRNLLVRKKNSYRNQKAARKELESRGISITKKYNRNDYK